MEDHERTEQRNLLEVYRLNQRGGRQLSIVDLIEVGTLSAPMAGLCWVLIAQGASFLTGAVPGGAGKTTVMAALLGLLPGERIETTSGPEVARAAAEGRLQSPSCLLAHEIGQGMWYGYIWGEAARDFFSLRGPRRRRVTCLHADTPEQCRAVLADSGVGAGDLADVALQLYIRVGRGLRPVRRVGQLHCRLDGALTPVFTWNPHADRHEQLVGRRALAAALAGPPGPEVFLALWDGRTALLRALVREAVRDFEEVRARVLEAYLRG